jgi:DNA-binding NarL/FixJ family response regulator
MIDPQQGSRQMANVAACVHSTPVRVMLVDDHTVVRRGLRALIESVPGWEVCAEASEGHEAVMIAVEVQPDIVVMDLSMPKLGGIDAAIQLRKALPGVEVLILTMHESGPLIAQALKAGARGYLLKSESEDRLMEALAALSDHHPYFSVSVSETLLQGFLSLDSASDPNALTPRARQIVKLVAEGKTNKRIAIILRTSIKTVETHRASAMRKVGARSSADLTLYAVRNDLVEV